MGVADSIESAASTLRVDFMVALDPRGRTIVKRDMELIRKILLEVESWPDAQQRTVQMANYDSNVVVRHVEMLCSAGLLETFGEPRRIGGPNQFIIIKDLSWSGHEFLDAIKNENIWSRVKQSLSSAQLASVPIELIKFAAIEVGKAYLSPFLGKT
jgi:hypothetical protein